ISARRRDTKCRYPPLPSTIHNTNVIEIPVSLGVIETVSDHERIGNAKADISYFHGAHPPLRLIQQRRDAHRLGLPLLEQIDQVIQRNTAIDNILDDQHMRVLERDVEILGDLDFTRGRLALAVTGDAHEVDADVALDGAGEIGQKEARPLENADHVEVVL